MVIMFSMLTMGRHPFRTTLVLLLLLTEVSPRIGANEELG